jgi:hypothetical protein
MLTTLLSSITAIFIISVIFCGLIYISEYERAPLGERVQIFSIGLGMAIGVTLLLHG